LYYHSKIELNEKNKKNNNVTLTELDKTDFEEIISDTLLPYLKNEDFFFDGHILNKNKIRSLKIYESEKTSNELYDIESNKPRDFIWIVRKDDVVTYERYSKDITKEVLKKSQEKLNIKKEDITVNEYDKTKIFVVHGHDNEAKLEVARFIEKLGFTPIILHEQASNSKTIIEKIESYSDVGFGVVIYTPCDVGAKQSDSSNLNFRARQNVVFEHGFLIGKLGRPNICSLVKGNIETPNDISGIVYTSMDSQNWQFELAKEMKASGYKVDMNKII